MMLFGEFLGDLPQVVDGRRVEAFDAVLKHSASARITNFRSDFEDATEVHRLEINIGVADQSSGNWLSGHDFSAGRGQV